jgi:hypothetical protein
LTVRHPYSIGEGRGDFTLPLPVYKILKAPDFHDLDNLGDPDKDVAISCSSWFVARLYDQKKSFASSHHNINKLQVKLTSASSCVLYKSGQSKTSWSETTFTISGFPNEPAM